MPYHIDNDIEREGDDNVYLVYLVSHV